ncbi:MULTISPECIES: NRAMP family divalent metal transporter [unclassified Campylobacter]|uniref:NRAMP family divalent metal transporter n=1 Tax=unclassified Campylobacter TaxID=2593542 RepID=UPI001BD9A5BE|nr:MULTISPECIES: NRAMP family divalent metal transporter [unclassified Campylobacter]MBZ7978435.1 divalent metal cation transporter [Campylobacter sp. RM12654]MBZ7982294.1 divalent metal cation transporter [Campylobacter sp. RM12640]MBZ7984140.1 divalent metal cation transporter [Campylobacter sp. RM12647]MBZ7989440.1 divalent metal cation transporter [Campylobacter sp. RM12635]MBZ7993411.1 divalent metal cation transporter [Campylobacter sp. RM9333]
MKNNKAILGAAFLMATSAVGPGFLTQTASFTQSLGASFAFIILMSVLMDIGVQFNVWRIIAVSKLKAQDIANKVFPGVGYLLSFLIILGGLAFNIGNIAGAGLGFETIFGINPILGACISAVIAIGIFINKDAGAHMDRFAKILGAILILIIIYIVFKSNPPLKEVAIETFAPSKFDALSLVTLIGGTVGGYITFSGAHRLLDAGICGVENLKEVSKSSVSGIIIASIIRVFLFLAVLGVISLGVSLNPNNPALTPFEYILGNFGSVVFGIVIWAASITSVVGCAYTSVSFISSFSPWLKKNENNIIIAFIIFSTLVFSTIGKPTAVLILVGTLNGFILPIALCVILIAAYKKNIVGDYKHSKLLALIGWLITIAMAYLCYVTLMKYINS